MTTKEMEIAAADKGLEGIIAAKTAISYIDGQHGRLFYRGIEINELVDHSTFEETTYLLWHGTFPTSAELQQFRHELIQQRRLHPSVIALLRDLPTETTPMEVLRTGASVLSSFETNSSDVEHNALLHHAIHLTAAMPSLVAAWERIRSGKEIIEPRADLDHAANFLYMLTGKVPNERAARVLDIALILHADHGLNASTFAARVVASTLADMYSAVTAALCTLKGPRHGGANEQVMRMLEDIKTVDRAEEFVKDALAKHKLMMGFGHRVYRADDPRALQLRRLAKEVSDANGTPVWYEISETIATTMHEAKPDLPINVDFFSASTYAALGIPTDLFTPIFAISRTAGWTGHVIESFDNHTRLIRPDAVFIGELDRHYVPIGERHRVGV
ncbi:MAG: citrate/2-methylcitrate synthase [Herpetosiphon sp.]